MPDRPPPGRDLLTILAEMRTKIDAAHRMYGDAAEFRIAVRRELFDWICRAQPELDGSPEYLECRIVPRRYVPMHEACMLELAAEDPEKATLEQVEDGRSVEVDGEGPGYDYE